MNITFLYIFSPVNDLPQNSLEWSFGLFQIEFILFFLLDSGNLLTIAEQISMYKKRVDIKS